MKTQEHRVHGILRMSEISGLRNRLDFRFGYGGHEERTKCL